MTNPWIEAMRLRTLPVAVAGVLTGAAFASLAGVFQTVPAVICLVFAVLAQIASNFANEYFDYRGGLDKPGREGPRRGVTEGDISPRAMLTATIATLALACAVGCLLIPYGGWGLIAVGLFVAAGVFFYSAGPYPLSHHCLGEVAVVVFFGLVPVAGTFYVMCGQVPSIVWIGGFSLGLMGANVLIINNYRDYADDYAVGKHTLTTKFGPGMSLTLYLLDGFMAIAMLVPLFLLLPVWTFAVPVIYLVLHSLIWRMMTRRTGSALNPLLGLTSMNMLLFAVLFAMAVSLVGIPDKIQM